MGDQRRMPWKLPVLHKVPEFTSGENGFATLAGET